MIAAVFGVFALVTSALRDTTRVFVVVDSSFPMTTVWSRVEETLDEIDNEERAEFALATEKDLIHGFQSELVLVGVEPFAPCDFGAIMTYPLTTEADELVLITTPSSCDTTALAGWDVVELTP
ncbi:MAG: hypothetical protein ACR2O6_12140 [Ilumatobacteraceae bacterium]